MWFILVLSGWLALGAPAQAGAAGARLSELKKDSRVFERIIGEILRQHFTNPFAVAAEPQGAYLPGYGVVVTFHLKINRGTIRGFWGEVGNTEPASGTSREDQLATVRRLLVQVLSDYAATMKSLDPGERVSVCAHVEDRNELNPGAARVEIVAVAKKSDIDLYATRKITLEDFQSRVSLLEY
jgi:hypothetical protein